MRVWSSFQKNIFKFVESGTGNALVEAVPGSGKSTTLVEALNYIPDHLHRSTLFLAFNKKIVNELKDKTPEGVTCLTFHSFCLRVLKSKNPRLKVDAKGEKLKKIIISLIGDDPDDKDTHETLEQVINLAKASLCHTADAIEEMMVEYDIEPTRRDFTGLVLQALELSAQQHQVVDFADMIWFISRFDMKLPVYAFVMIDEAQDSNPGRIDVCRRLLNPNTRMIAVGDKNQVIFQFCGACEDSMEQLHHMMDAQTFPLSVSYRCARLIVAEASKYITGIQAYENAIEGVVQRVSKDKMLAEAGPGDFIISRVNAPLVGLCLAFIRDGKRCNIQGRDMGRSMNWMIKSSKAKNVSEFLTYLDEWAKAQYERLTKKKIDTSHIDDRVACLEALCEGTDNIAVVRGRIKDLFAEVDKNNPGSDKIILTSAHRSKGLEKDRVWILDKTFKASGTVAETNLKYVAVTRAKTHLFIVTDVVDDV